MNPNSMFGGKLHEDFTSRLSSWLTIPALFLAYYAVSSLLVWYRLRHIRGPFLASFSYLWLTRATLLTARCTEILDEQTRRYGSLVRIGPNDVATSDPEVVRRMAAARSTYRRSDYYRALTGVRGNRDLLTEVDSVRHDLMKKLCASSFCFVGGGPGGTHLERTLDRHMAALKHAIRSRYLSSSSESRPWDFGKFAPFFTADIIMDMAWSRPLEYLALEANKEFCFLEEVNIGVMLTFGAEAPNPYLRRLGQLLNPIIAPSPTARSGFGKMLGYFQDLVKERFAKYTANGEVRDMLDGLIRNGLGAEDCYVMLPLILGGGVEPIAVALRGLMLNIINSPVVYRKLKEEIRLAAERGTISKPVQLAEAEALPYLQAVIQESIRLSPGTRALMGKTVPKGGDVINGLHIPAGTTVHHNMGSLLRSRALFGPDADIFRPERFLDCDEDRRWTMARDVELQFGSGRWTCVGRNIAMMVINKTAVELLRSFDFQSINPEKPWRYLDYGGEAVIHDFWLRVTEDDLG